jgi:FMN reductase
MTGQAFAVATGAERIALEYAVLVGNPRGASRTLAVAGQVAAFLVAGLAGRGVAVPPPSTVDLAALGPELAAWESASPHVSAATAAVCDARLLLVASPTFKGSYSGLLKLFLDRLPRQALTGVVAVPLMTAREAAHAHAVDTCLRPVLLELGAAVPTRGLSVLEADFGRVESAVRPWGAAALPVLAALLDA